MKAVKIYTFTDIKGPRKKSGHFMYLLEYETSKGIATLHDIVAVETEETENKIQLQAIIKAAGRVKKPCEIEIHTHSLYVSSAINGSTMSFYREDGEEYDIRVRYAPEFRTSIEDIEKSM